MAEREVVLQRFFSINSSNEFVDESLSTINTEFEKPSEEELVQRRIQRLTWGNIYSLASLMARRQSETGFSESISVVSPELSNEQPSLEKPRASTSLSWKGAGIGAVIGSGLVLVLSQIKETSFESYTTYYCTSNISYCLELAKYYSQVLDVSRYQGNQLAAVFLVSTGALIGGVLRNFKRQ